MAEVTVTVTAYPGATTGLELEEWSQFGGWVDASDITPVIAGSVYTATVTSPRPHMRARWIHAAGETHWFAPTSITERRVPTEEQAALIRQAVIAKAARIYLMTGAPLGHTGDLTDMGISTVRPDYTSRELLKGLRFVDWDVDHEALVTADDVIVQGLGGEGADYPDAIVDAVESALAGAWSWLATEILDGIPIV